MLTPADWWYRVARLSLSRSVAFTAREWLELCARADAHGLAAVAAADIAGADCFVDAAVAAAVSPRIAINVLIALPVRSALQTATAAANLSSVTGRGRLTLGLGAGSDAVIEGGHGGVFAPPVARLRDFVGAVAALLRGPAGQPVRYDGRFVRAAGVGAGFSPRDLPIVIGASGPRMVRLACELADGLALHLLTARSVLRQRVALARSIRGSDFPISAGVLTSVHDDVGEALRRARLELAAACAIPRFLPRLAEAVGDDRAGAFAAAVRAGRLQDAAMQLDEPVVREFVLVCRPHELADIATSFDGIDTLSPVPVGQFAQYFPSLGLTAADWHDSQARTVEALFSR